MSRAWIDFAYLVAAICLILGIKRLSHPRTARSGNWIAAVGMAIAVGFTFLIKEIDTYWLMLAGIAVGTVIGVAAARMVRMTAIPQMVALFNGVGGGAAALIAAAEFHRAAPFPGHLAGEELVGILFSAFVGSVSFWGSLVAFGKLQELVPGRPIVFPAHNLTNALLGLTLAGAIALTAITEQGGWLAVVMVGALVLGVLFVLPIGGADMPVVISLLNAFTGLAAASTGFVLDNTALIIGGTLVGASGTLLTIKMGQAMGRPLRQTLFGAFGAAPDGASAVAVVAADGDGSVRTASADDIAFMLAYARRVVFVPGYGLAVAQAQHDVRNLAELLEHKGVDVRYAIHPVAGRMPGHMNVLLAEANVPYDELFEMDEINPEFPQTDVVVVVGANDVVNPAARNQPGNPIYGMPILDVDKAHNVVVIKRSLSPGFAGVDNPLFYDQKTVMLFADAKAALEQLVTSVKGV
ncbi:MAG TPA: NAD(P)(+) transhydrogenase (Re/Si-specific) subunit beta [Gaiellaceae bacterium]|nr:NAD(P)(+) transhydrogenase (Re/Si-specific) subunit beta [Gaiellaceae bacterium]